MLEDIGQQMIQLQCGEEFPKINIIDCGQGKPFLYLHGWGQDHSAFLPLLDILKSQNRHIAIDFPGFGKSPQPKSGWNVSEYADFVYEFIKERDISPCTVIGHSFGGRVGFRLAHQHPESVRGLFLMASAGIRRKAPFFRQIRVKTIRTLARSAKLFIPGGIGEKIKQSLYDRIASRDYKQAGPMRKILVKVINDDVSSILPQIQTPVMLIYGSDDLETPPELGRDMQKLLPNAEYTELPGFDHYSILTRGRHQAVHQLKSFLERIERKE